jgi:APA family basic amino acid/polyamine antiporter
MKSEKTFKQELGLFDGTMIVVGSMIGSGIFIVSADIARTVGASGLLLLVWVITGIMTLIGALSYGELAAMFPKAGGQYIFLREAYNPLIAFLYGWTLFAVIQTGTIAAVAVAFSKFTSVIFPFFSEKNILLTIFGLKISSAQILAILSIAILTLINTLGIREGKLVQDIFTFSKTIVLIGIILLGFIIGSNAEAIAANFSNMWNGQWIHFANGSISVVESLSGFTLVAAIGAAMVGSLFSSDAWNNVTFAAAEVKNPKKNLPLSLFYGTVIVTVLYVLTNLSYLVVLPLQGNPDGKSVVDLGIQFAAEDRVGTAVASNIFGGASELIMAVLIMISTFGCNNGLILAGARVYYAMAKDNLFFKAAGRLNKNSVPAAALVFQGIWASILCLSGTYSDLLDYVIFAVLIFYILTISGIFVLRKKKPNLERPCRAFGYPVLPLIYIFLAGTISTILLIYKPQYTWPGLIIVLIGIPIYLLWKKLLKNRTT